MNKILKFAYIQIITTLTIILFTNLSCNSTVKGKEIDEGVIEYKINYLEDIREKPMITFFPNQMITVFKHNSTYSIVDGGLFSLVYITNFKKGKNITLFKVLDRKYMYITDTSITPLGYHLDNKIILKYTNKEKTIAGYPCKQAFAIFPRKQDTINIYYTEVLGIKHPNFNNPYKTIDGVLMEFTVNMLDINMEFKAIKVKKKKVDPELFNPPKDYELISKKEMEKIINEYNGNSNN